MSDKPLPTGWEVAQLGDMTEHRHERVGRHVPPRVLSSTKHHGLVSSDSYFKGRQIYSEDLKPYRVVEPRWFAYATNHLAEGSIGMNEGEVGCVSPMYTVFSAADDVEPRYLWRVLKSPGAMREYALHEQASVDRRGAIRYRDFARIPALKPPLLEQRRIADVFDEVDDAIARTQQLVLKLSMCGQAVMEEALGNLDRYSEVTVDDVAERIVVGIVVRPSQYYRESGIPVLRSANVRASGLQLTDLVHMSEADHRRNEKSRVQPGDLVTVRTGAPGTTAVVPDTLPTANCVDIVITRPRRDLVLPRFLALWVNSNRGRGQVLRAQAGLAQQHFNVSEMRGLRLPLAPLDLQADIVKLSTTLDATVNLETSALQTLLGVRAALTDDLLSGSVRTVLP